MQQIPVKKSICNQYFSDLDLKEQISNDWATRKVMNERQLGMIIFISLLIEKLYTKNPSLFFREKKIL